MVYTTLEGDIWLVQTDGTGAHKLGPTGAPKPIGPHCRLTAANHPVFDERQDLGDFVEWIETSSS